MIDGFEQVEKERNEIYLYGQRKVIYHVVRALAGKKAYKKEQDVFALDLDKVIRKQRIKKMKPVEITRVVKDDK